MPDIDIIIKAQDKASGALKDVNSELGKMDGHSKGLPGPLKTLSGILGEGLRLAAIGAAAALTGLGVAMASSITKAASMEQSVADIRSIFGKTAPSAKELGDAITGLGLDPKLKVDATEAAAAINMLAKNGITWDEIQGGMAKSTVLLANATNDNFTTAADVATNAMVNFNKSAGDMTDVVNGIIGVTQASQFDINDYALALGQAGGVAGAVGVDFEDFNAMLAATSSSFNSGEDAGTSFKTFLQRLVPNTEPASDAMRKLGLFSGLSGKEFDKLSEKMAGVENSISSLDPTSADYSERLAELTKKLAAMRVQLVGGSSAFFDAQGNMESGEVIAGALAEAFNGLSDSERIQAASTIFGTDAMRTALDLADAGSDTILKFKKQIRDVSAEDAAATRMDTLKGSWEIFTGVVDALQIQLETAFLPILKDVVDWLTKLATEHGPAVIAWFTKLSSAIGNFLAEIKNSKDPMAQFRDSFEHVIPPSVMTAITNIVGGIQTFIKVAGDILGPLVSWKDLMIALGIAFTLAAIPAIVAFLAAAAPVVVLIAGITAAVALLRHAWEGDWGGIQEKTKATMDYLNMRFGGLLDTLKKFGPDALKEIGAFVTGNETKFTALSAIWDSTKKTAQSLFADMAAAATNIGGPFLRWFDTNFPQASAALRTAFEGVSKRLGELWEVISKAFSGGSGNVKVVLDKLQAWWKEHGDEVQRIVDNFLKLVITIISTAIQTMTNVLKLFFQVITGDWKGAWETIKDTANLYKGLVKVIWETFINNLKELWKLGLDDLLNNAKTKWESIKKTIADRIDEILANVKTKWETIRTTIGDKMRDLDANTLTKWDELKAGTSTKVDSIASYLATKWEEIKNTHGTKIAAILAEAGPKWEAIKKIAIDKIAEMATNLTTKWEEIKTAIANKLSDIVTSVTTKWDSIKTTITTKIGEIVTSVTEKWEAIKTAISTKMGEIVTTVTSKAAEIVTGFTTGIANFVTSVTTKMGEVKTAITSPFADAGTWLLSAGQNVVQGFINGIGNMIGAAQAKIAELAKLITDAANLALGIKSPSKVFMEIGQNVAAGFGLGIENGMAKLAPTMGSLGTWAPPLASGSSTVNNTNTTNKSNAFNVYVQGSGNAVQDIRNQVELYALTFGGA